MAWGTLVLELQMTLSHRVGTGTEPDSFGRTVKTHFFF